MGRNENLPLLTPWEGAGRRTAVRLNEKKSCKSGAYSVSQELWIFLQLASFPECSYLLFRPLKTSENIGLAVLVKLRSNTGVRR